VRKPEQELGPACKCFCSILSCCDKRLEVVLLLSFATLLVLDVDATGYAGELFER
jgi:hypothetical protein